MTTKTTIALAELAEKGADTDLLRDMVRYVAQRLMELDTESPCAAAYGERSPERANSRNGYRERLWQTRAGSVDAFGRRALLERVPALADTAWTEIKRRTDVVGIFPNEAAITRLVGGGAAG